MIAKFIKRNILMYADGVIAATDAINATYSLSNKITVNNYPISDRNGILEVKSLSKR